MFQSLRQRQPGRPVHRILWWHLLHGLCWAWFLLCYRFRAFGQRHVPASGPILLVANHQSFLDPIVVGLGSHHRQFFALARSTLFDRPAVAWLIRSLNALPVERGESDTTAMRRCIDLLVQRHALLVFPEGTRTPDGTTHAFSRGIMLLIKRARPTVVPVALEGTFDVWPRTRKVPHLTGRVAVRYGQPIAADALLAMPPDAALAHLQHTIESMRRDLATATGHRIER